MSYKVTEVCPHCDIENTYRYANFSEVKRLEKCNGCGRLIPLCSECECTKCKECEDGSHFVKYK